MKEKTYILKWGDLIGKYSYEILLDKGFWPNWFDLSFILTYDSVKQDHAPEIQLLVVLFGLRFEFSIYNKYHAKNHDFGSIGKCCYFDMRDSLSDPTPAYRCPTDDWDELPNRSNV